LHGLIDIRWSLKAPPRAAANDLRDGRVGFLSDVIRNWSSSQNSTGRMSQADVASPDATVDTGVVLLRLVVATQSRLTLLLKSPYCTALIMSKIGRYIATTIPPTITPKNTIITGSMRLNSPLTAVSTSVS
jgi:hypothetical protein